MHLPRVRWNRTTSESYVDASEMRFDTELYMGEHVSGVTVPTQYLDLKNEFKLFVGRKVLVKVKHINQSVLIVSEV